ncbi:SHOCT domain-containing protein [Halobacterium wangiae]|uniref:SHOCT domain-containing protein n=1 Tax=Halobacterium wangiae TaxID=2902623 RepID=UPI001E6235FF|nr:SHOCT domain-containing protein [Halobacterium wangiae]
MTGNQGSDSLLRVVLVVLAVVLLSPLLMMVVAMPMVGMMGWGGRTWVSPLWGFSAMLVSLLVVLGVGYVLYRALTDTGETVDPALEELRLAYARGDISDEEFEQRRRRLREGE